jgi:hypothetical protein
VSEIEVKERPIDFTAEQVRAALEGRMTQTRRVVKWPNPAPAALRCASDCKGVLFEEAFPGLVWGATPGFFVPCKDGAQQRWRNPWDWPNVRTRLWVRETWRSYDVDGTLEGAKQTLRYRADREEAMIDWCSPVLMPRWASRLTLEVTGVRVERLQDISIGGMLAEGVLPDEHYLGSANRLRHPFIAGWDALNKRRGFGWDANPWVWVVSFQRVEDVAP